MTVAAATAPRRQDVRRARTRARLVAATRRLVAERGPDAVAIADIAASADLGFGTFYNHFESKDAALLAAAEDAAEDLGGALDTLTASMDDPAEVLCVSMRHVLARAVEDEAWGWFIVRTWTTHDVLARHLGPRLLRDLDAGEASGRFATGSLPAAAIAIGGVMHAAIRARLDGVLGPDDDITTVAQVLRMLGVPPARAHRLAARPLPALPSPAPEGSV